MIRKVKDHIDQFLLVTVPSPGGTYQVLYMVIPSINQIQAVAREYPRGKWTAIGTGNRTVREKLPLKWTVPIQIEELSLNDVKKLCHAVIELEFSTKMLEDMKLRKRWKWEQVNR